MDPNTLENMEGYLLGIGNPLLDISACVKEETLKKYGLRPDDAIMAEEKHMPLYKELVNQYQAEFLAGGSVQNSLRVAQWILKKPNICTYFGCVGDDDYAKILKDRATADGVTVQYQVTKEEPTGTCAVLITGNHRSLCANLAAARKFTPDHLDKPESKRSIELAKIIYVSGFFIPVSLPSILKVAEHAHRNNLPFVLNLSAAFVSEAFKNELRELLPYVDILFGNELEATAFAKEFGFEDTDLQGIALKVAAYPKLNKNRQRVVVLTHGSLPVVLVENGVPTLVPVTPLPSEEIVDTNGAGDAFTGGFLAQLIKGRPYVTCVKCGIYAAGVIIRRSGCSFSGESEFVDS